ncbi:MAG: hypothetical protein AB1758_24625, partial [Candidatus Eremiobacterota bacterium]
PLDRVDLQGEAPQPRVDSRGAFQAALEWSADAIGSVWRFLVVGTRIPEVAQPLEPLQTFRNPDVSGVIVAADRVYNPEVDRQEIHSYAATDAGQLALLRFDELAALGTPQPPPRRFRYVGNKALQRQVDSVHKTRKRGLKLKVIPGGDRAVPKDASLNPSAYTMFSQADEEAGTRFVNQMARIGLVEGFHLVTGTTRGSTRDVRQQLDPKARANVSVVPASVGGEIWTEDYGERTLEGGVAVPAFVYQPDQLAQALYRDRIRRFYPGARPEPVSDYEDLVAREYPLANFSAQGSVGQSNLQWSMLALGSAARVPLRENLSHVEGGNLLVGTLPDGNGYALVGRDSVAVTRHLLAEELQRQVGEKEALRVIAADLGLEPQRVFPVEQPGEFHLDMRMMLAGPGQVVLNDAREAAELQIAWLESDLKHSLPRHPGPGSSVWQRLNYHRKRFLHKRREHRLEGQRERLRAEASRRARYEDMCLKDLKAAGLTVLRMAGVFVHPDRPDQDVANFLNGRAGTNEQGQRFYVGLGADSRAEVYAARRLMLDLPTGIQRVHFLDRTYTPDTLGLYGGIKCRTKPEGDLVPATQLKTAAPPALTVATS